MKLREALTNLRTDLADDTAPYLWSDAEFVRWIAEGEQEAARRAHLFLDSTTPEICRIQVVANKSAYELDKRIIRVDRVRLDSRTLPLSKMFRRDLDIKAPGWETLTGPVTGYCLDYTSGWLRLIRIPTATDAMTLTVLREPMIAPSLDRIEDDLSLPDRWQESMLNWPKYRAFSKPDSEAKNDKLAEMHLTLFENEFGVRSSAKNEAWEATHHGEEDMEGLS